MNLQIKNIKLLGDKAIWTSVFSLSLFSLLLVYSTEGISDLIRHGFKLFLGIFCMYIVHKIKFKYFSKLGQLSYFISVILLILVFVIGVSVNGASRWLSIAGQQFQPSDIAKIAVLVFMARQISKNRDQINKFSIFFLHVLSPLLLICILVLPNNFSTSALIFINGLVLMFVSKVRFKFLISIFFTAIFTMFSIYFLAKYTSLGSSIIPRSYTWVSRFDAFLFDKEGDEQTKDYQQNQAFVAIQNGGFIGLGPGKSTQKSILPYSSSDFIFAIVIEEYGLIGASFLLLLYLILLFRSIRIYLRTESMFARLVTISLMFGIVFQALINMLVSVGIMPVTGQTLPLISMGGTSIVFTCIALGIILSISQDASDRSYEKI